MDYTEYAIRQRLTLRHAIDIYRHVIVGPMLSVASYFLAKNDEEGLQISCSNALLRHGILLEHLMSTDDRMLAHRDFLQQQGVYAPSSTEREARWRREAACWRVTNDAAAIELHELLAYRKARFSEREFQLRIEGRDQVYVARLWGAQLQPSSRLRKLTEILMGDELSDSP